LLDDVTGSIARYWSPLTSPAGASYRDVRTLLYFSPFVRWYAGVLMPDPLQW